MRKLLVPFFAVFFLVGCANAVTPETPRERLAAAEVTYQAAVSTVRDFIVAGTLKPGTQTAEHAATSIRTARVALDAWHAAPDNEDQMTTALLALQALNTVLLQLKEGLQNGGS